MLKWPLAHMCLGQMAGRLGYAEEEMRGLAEGLVESLTGSSRLVEAAAIAVQHLADGDSAVALLAQAREWREALRTAALFDRQDLVETTVAPAAAEAASALLVRPSQIADVALEYLLLCWTVPPPKLDRMQRWR